ncbi:MAG: Lrp/AsnC family transcriptional regulator [Candidatus Micrarchaeota archaeon]|nr:Lrp/AsnC family transcriptional regulator [Candidatus Micrarchaeota archaeon]MDE1847718.1 Lrp/AsnC family transcriptional regulator [Candidatus Micrarchaeota archaeon]MDE1864147.1 Lrp/AsnC family transcriptional regulator [Candidatus Micrarchaeota archaeon]
MKNIRKELIELMKSGYCAPRIVEIAKKLKEPSTTIHYNIKQMEKGGEIVGYRAVLDHKKIEEGFCTYVLISLSPDEYTDPERIAKELSKYPQIEDIDVITGGWEMIIKVRSKDIDEYYQFVKNVLSKKGIAKTTSLNSLKEVKSNYVTL